MGEKKPGMTSAQIRERFLNFFSERGHQAVASSPVVPHGDATLMFTNSGMVQFKDVFLGSDARPYKRAASVQACIRAGGKHNDLENVGHTARHHTFFEMLGNWSFGDYFKKEALQWSWELLTSVYGLDPERLWATVYEEDQEAYDIWTKQIGLPPERVVRIGDNKGARYASDNFWMMADTGPCGPCSEIFYDHGPEIAGGPPGSPEEDGDRFIEIWNNVFMQFDMSADGKLSPLPAPCVDTGMGLERLAAILQGVHSNYEIDTFKALIEAAARETKSSDLESDSLKVIADHLRSCAFMIADGVAPSNEGRGFVLRRIARRAVRHGYKLGARAPFMHKLAPDLSREMGEAYPQLRLLEAKIANALRDEEAKFFETVGLGMGLFDEAVAESKTKLSGEAAFKLHDTYGFPLDLTRDLCRERGIELDENGFEACMERQREMGRASTKFAAGKALEWHGAATEFYGREKLAGEARILGLFVDGLPVRKVSEGREAVVVVDRTPFYAEGGGQCGDAGMMACAGAAARVAEAFKIKADVWGHKIVVEKGEFSVGAQAGMSVDAERRLGASIHHTAAHMLHWALGEVLGSGVRQMGQSVEPGRARFDFAHGKPMDDAQIERVERLVNDAIRSNAEVSTIEMPLDQAKSSGAKSLDGEKYGQMARVVSVGASRELCGGTHASRAGDLGLFRVKSESGVASGVRRIEALAGKSALDFTLGREAALRESARAIKTEPTGLAAAVRELDAKSKKLEKAITAQGQQIATSKALAAMGSFEPAGEGYALALDMGDCDPRALRGAIDALLGKKPGSCVALGCSREGKSFIAAGSNIQGVSADDVAKAAALALRGSGGGKEGFAMAGGADPKLVEGALEAALARIKSVLESARKAEPKKGL